jgi:hypothetical protein
MEHSTIADLAGFRALAVQAGLVVVGVMSFVILFSFGGQLVVAPGLLPAQWILARHTDGWVATAFSVLGSLLLFEVAVIALPFVFGDAPAGVAAAVVCGLLGALVFYHTSRRG